MRKLRKIVLFGIPLALLLCYLFFIFLRIQKEEKNLKLKGVEVVLKNPEFNFVDKKEILSLLEKEVGAIREVKQDSVNKNKIEELIEKNPFVEEVQMFRSASNMYRIEITQRSPILRVLTAKESYYLDREGYRMPTGVKYPALVHIYKGDISQDFAKKTLLYFQTFLNAHPVWAEMIDYISVNSKKELILHLKVQSGEIYFGKVEDIENKLNKLRTFIDKVGKHKGLEFYKSIDLRFDNQIVVKKNKNATK